MATNRERPAVLVLGDDTRSFLSVVRSFGQRGFAVDACPHDFTSPALASSYVRQLFRLPLYHLDPDRWVSETKKILAEGGYSFIVPCDDRSILPIHRHQADLGDHPFALPNDDAIRYFYDKHETRELAIDAGVPVARGRLLTPEDTAQGLADEFGFPVAIKPRSSYVLSNVGLRNKVLIVRDVDGLKMELAQRSDWDCCLIEKAVPGHGAGISVLARQGRLIQAFEYHRVHEPRAGGGSSYRVSHRLNPRLVDYVERLTQASRLDGVAMFEFRFDPESGQIHLLEVNARFWGGLPLAIYAGIDFPWLLYRQSIGNEQIAASTYRVGVYARHLTADFYTIFDVAQDISRQSAFRSITYLVGSVTIGLIRLAVFREKIDSFDWSDMAPFKQEFGHLLGSIGDKIGRKLGASPGRKALKARREVASSLRRISGRIPRILFVCYGNICRSPFAALYLQAKAGDTLAVASTGVHPVVGRQSPADALACAREWGVDLSAHRSSHISLSADDPVDLVVLFDSRNQNDFLASGCHRGIPVVRLGDFLNGDDTGTDIADPYGRDSDGFRRVYGQITEAANALLSLTQPDRTG